LSAATRQYTAKSATETTMKLRVNIQRRYGIVRFMNWSGSPTDQRSRKMSPLNGLVESRCRRCARRRSIWSTVRSPRVRSRRPMALSLLAKPSTAAAETRRPDATSSSAISAGERVPSNCRMTRTSTGRNRKYLWVLGSFRMKLCSPR